MSEQELELPKGWVEATLQEICSVITDGVHKTPDYQESGIPFISIKNIRPFKFLPKAYVRYISEEAHDEMCKRCEPKFDDILLTKIGSLGYAKRVNWKSKFNIFVGLALLRPKKIALQSEFLEAILNSPQINRQCISGANGSGRMTLPLVNLRNMKFLLPPLNEQKRIVSKIEELFSKIDSTKQSLEQTKLQLEQYRHSLLKSAFEGKLTEKWRKENKIDENSKNNPLGELIIFSKNGFTGKPNELKKGTPRLGIETITQSDSIYVDESMHKFIEIPKSKIDTYRAKIGDLFVCRQNGNQNYVGKCAIFKEIISPMIFSDSLIQFRINVKLISPVYLAFFINSHLGRRQIEKFCSTTAGNFSINGTNIKKIIISYPSLLEEQEQIVSQIEQAFSLIQNTTQIVTSTLQILQTMKMSVLKQAFEGKLVPQDPNDEPAQILLEKIKATKDAKPTKKRRAKNVK